MGVRYDIMRMSEKIQCPGCGLRFHDPRRVAAGKLASSRLAIPMGEPGSPKTRK